MRTTIDYGIDLGTTNSSIAVCDGAVVEVFRNNNNSESTPSAVMEGRNGEIVVGAAALARVVTDPANCHLEFKLGMGSAHRYTFARSGRSMSAPELSTEVLKSLRADVRQRRNEDIQAAVITVPAAFELPQCTATQEAARLAGLSLSHLVTEPAAAAFAFSRQNRKDKAFWLVFDLGGGTFDAAIVQLRDGSVQVVNHGGDNHLGGKLIDWAIVEDVLVPALLRERKLSGFGRANDKWSTPLRILKREAEMAKILLSRASTHYIDVSNLCVDDRGETVNFEFELTREHVERCAAPIIERAINFCRRVLVERRLGPGDVDRVVLVGGPTMMPILRAQVADALGIPVDFSMDPLTVVAQGASLYAASQRMEHPTIPRPPSPGRYDLVLDYKPVGAEAEFLVGGHLTGPSAQMPAGTSVEFSNVTAQPPWFSGRVDVTADGKFFAHLWAQGVRQRNRYSVVVRDGSGAQLAEFSDVVSYMVDVEMPNPPLLQSVGVGLLNDDVEWFLRKGADLPAKKRNSLRVAVGVGRGQVDGAIRIPLLEGESDRADRNQVIGCLEIPGTRLTRDVPAGCEIEVTVEIDTSRVVSCMAYLPHLDEEFEMRVNFDDYRKGASDAQALREGLARESRRLEDLRKKVADTGDATAAAALRVVDDERMLHDVETSLAAAHGDPDAADKAQKRLLDLRIALDRVEDAVQWPALVARAENEIEVERTIFGDSQYQPTAEERAAFVRLERDVRAAIAAADQDALKARVNELDRLGFLIVVRHPGWWMARLHHLEGRRPQMRDQELAAALSARGRRAIDNNDFDGLKAAVLQLEELLPVGDPDSGVSGPRGTLGKGARP